MDDSVDGLESAEVRFEQFIRNRPGWHMMPEVERQYTRGPQSFDGFPKSLTTNYALVHLGAFVGADIF